MWQAEYKIRLGLGLEKNATKLDLDECDKRDQQLKSDPKMLSSIKMAELDKKGKRQIS